MPSCTTARAQYADKACRVSGPKLGSNGRPGCYARPMSVKATGRRLLELVRPADSYTGTVGGMQLRVPRQYRGTYLSGGYEPEMGAALRHCIRPGDVCADVGAHIGWFCLLMAEASGADGRVVAFEADPANAQCIQANVEANGLSDRVAVECVAVSSDSGEATLWDGRRGSSMEFTLFEAFADREGSATGASRTVRTVSLDDYFGEGARLDVVKMDIEGAEAKALPGMARLLRRERPIIVLEFHREVGWPGVLTLLDLGYRFFTLTGEPCPTPESAEEVPYQSIVRPPSAP